MLHMQRETLAIILPLFCPPSYVVKRRYDAWLVQLDGAGRSVTVPGIGFRLVRSGTEVPAK